MQATRFSGVDEMNGAVRELLIEAFRFDGGCDHAVMLSGGNTPLAAYRSVAESGTRASTRAHVLFSDERMAPADSPESNFGNTSGMLKALRLPEDRVLRVATELPLAEAASAYANDIDAFLNRGGRVTLGLLGMGADGHTASLFNLKDAERTDRLAIPIPRDPGPARVSVTAGFLRKIERIVFVVAGKDKAEVIHRLIEVPDSIPAGRAVAGARSVELWLA